MESPHSPNWSPPLLPDTSRSPPRFPPWPWPPLPSSPPSVPRLTGYCRWFDFENGYGRPPLACPPPQPRLLDAALTQRQLVRRTWCKCCPGEAQRTLRWGKSTFYQVHKHPLPPEQMPNHSPAGVWKTTSGAPPSHPSSGHHLSGGRAGVSFSLNTPPRRCCLCTGSLSRKGHSTP